MPQGDLMIPQDNECLEWWIHDILAHNLQSLTSWLLRCDHYHLISYLMRFMLPTVFTDHKHVCL